MRPLRVIGNGMVFCGDLCQLLRDGRDGPKVNIIECGAVHGSGNEDKTAE